MKTSLFIYVILVGIISSCQHWKKTKEAMDVQLRDICITDFDSMHSQAAILTERKYGKFYTDNFLGMPLVDSDDDFLIYRGNHVVSWNPLLDSIPELKFNYRTCHYSLYIIKVEPYKKK